MRAHQFTYIHKLLYSKIVKRAKVLHNERFKKKYKKNKYTGYSDTVNYKDYLIFIYSHHD